MGYQSQPLTSLPPQRARRRNGSGMSSTTAKLALMRAVRAERAKLGIGQQELADRVKQLMAPENPEMVPVWDYKHVSRIENGEASLRAEEIPAVCGALEVSVGRLYMDIEAQDTALLRLPALPDHL